MKRREADEPPQAMLFYISASNHTSSLERVTKLTQARTHAHV